MRIQRRKLEALMMILVLLVLTVPILGTQSGTESAGSGAKLTGIIYDDEGVDTDGNGLSDFLKIGVQVNVTESGIYNVAVSGLESSNGSYISIYKDKSMYLDLGLKVVDVTLPGPTIYVSRINPANVSTISLRDDKWIDLGYIQDVPLSREYLYTEFDRPGASLTGVMSDQGNDTDGSGFFDYLLVATEVNVSEPGVYYVNINGLLNASFQWISAYGYRYEYFELGLHNVTISLDGRAIHASGQNPLYIYELTLQDQDGTIYSRSYQVPLSRVYFFTEFDVQVTPPPSGASLTGAIEDSGVDSDGDSLFDYLKVGVQINVSIPGIYRVQVSSLRDVYWNYTNLWNQSADYFDSGVHVMNVSLFGPTIRASGTNPKYVSHIELRNENDTYIGYLNDTPLSHEYLCTEFDVPDAILTGVTSDQGVDLDSDGAFDYLEVSVEINVSQMGEYRVGMGNLLDAELNYIYVSNSVQTSFVEGIQPINLTLDGSTIYNSGRNPKFIDYISLQDKEGHNLGQKARIPLSREYSFDEFEAPGAELTGMILDQGVDNDANGLFDYLQVSVEINVTVAGTYQLSVGDVLDAELDYISVYNWASTYLPTGLHFVNVSLNGPAIYASSLNPRLIGSINLYDEKGRNLDSASRIPLSREYLYTEFDLPGARLTGVFSDQGVDTDGDGFFNYLEIGVEVNVTEAGEYGIYLSDLLDFSFNYISVYTSVSTHLNLGLQVISLQIGGYNIRVSGRDPVYVSNIHLIDLRNGEYHEIGRFERRQLSREYSHNEFEPPKAVLTGTIYDKGVDTDIDGKFNYLQVGIEINVTDPGNYGVDVSGLRDSNLNNINVYNMESDYLDAGVQVLNVTLYGPSIYASGLNPRYVSSIYFYSDTYSYLSNVPLSREYSFDEFDSPNAFLTGLISDSGVDSDGDGQFNYLLIGVQINVTEAGYCYLDLSGLLDENRSRIDVYSSTSGYFSEGVQTVYFYLDGSRIYRSGLNPHYIDYISLRGESNYLIGSLDNILLSTEYSYKEFEAPGAALMRIAYEQGVDSDGDGAFDYLAVGVELNVTEAGTYRVQISGLKDASNGYIDVYGSIEQYLTIGVKVIDLTLNGISIYLSERNPKYISQVTLRDPNYYEIGILQDVALSREYLYTEFERPGASLTGAIFDQGEDTDSDGTFDFLWVGVQVDVTEAGNYRVDVSELLDSSFSSISVYGSNYTFLNPGLTIVYVSLEGTRIYLSHQNPRYVDHIGLWDEAQSYSESLNMIPLSREYLYTEFDPPMAMLTGRIFDWGIDTDGNQVFNYLVIGVEINIVKQGYFSVSVDGLRDSYGYWISVWGSQSGFLDIGLGILNVSLNGPNIYASHRNPLYVTQIYLYTDYPDYINNVQLSREYSYKEFDFPAILTGAISDQGKDTDNDGLFDYLQIDVQVNVSDPGTYTLYVSGLFDFDFYYINVRDTKTTYLDAGVQTIDVYLYGPQIYSSRRNPAIVDYISLAPKSQGNYWPYDSISQISLSKQYSYQEFEAPFLDVQTKFIVYPDGRVAVAGSLNYTNMLPENTPRYTTAQGFFNLTGNGQASQAKTGLTLNLPPQIASEYPFNASTAQLLAKYSNGLLDFQTNATTVLPPFYASQYPFNSTDGTLKATYSGGLLNIQAEGNTTLPSQITEQFPFNATDLTVTGSYTPNMLKGTITFSLLPGVAFDNVNVDFKGNQTDLTLNGTVHIVFNVPLSNLIIHNETELVQILDELKNQVVGEKGTVWNLTDGLLNVTSLETNYDLNGIGASVTFRIDIHGDFIRALAYFMSGKRNETLLIPVLNEAYDSIQEGSFDIQYSHVTYGASVKLTFSYDLKRLLDYVLTPPTGTAPYVIASGSMSPTLWMGDVVIVDTVSNASDFIADPENGDIIAFNHPYYPGNFIIHRAIDKTLVNDTLYFQTKGDNNFSPDYWSGPDTWNGMISSKLVIGKVVSRIPLLGYLLYPNLYPYYYGYYYQGMAVPPSLWKDVFSSVQEASVQLSYSSADKEVDFQLSLIGKLKTLIDDIRQKLPSLLPPGTPPETREFIESFLNTTYASVDSADVSFSYANSKAEFEASATIDGDLNTELNYIKDLYFKLLGEQYSRYNIPIPWQTAFVNQTKIDVNNFSISAKLGETSLEGRLEGLTLFLPKDALNATHFKLERFFNLTAPQYPWEREFPEQDQRLQITVEGGSNATHSVMLIRPLTVPEPDLATPDGKSMVWFNQAFSGLKDLIFEIKPSIAKVPAQLDIDPNTLNLKSKRKWITAYVELPDGYSPEDIDASSILLNGTIQPVLDPKYGFVTNSSEYLVDYDNDGTLERMVRFDGAALISWIYHTQGIRYGNVALTIAGTLSNGAPFEGTDYVRINYAGDVNDDGKIDLFDILEIKYHCSGPPPSAGGYDINADIDKNGCINVFDILIAKDNLGLSVPSHS